MPSMPGIEMSSSTASNRVAWIWRSARDRVAGHRHLGHLGRLQQQPAQLVQRRRDVVDREHPQAGHDATTPGWNRGSRSSTRVPAPGAVSMTSP